MTACESNGFSGAVLVAKSDSIILNKGYGLANKEKSFANTPKTVFDICSVTKQFTGTAIFRKPGDQILFLAKDEFLPARKKLMGAGSQY